ncbi:hypothetical protein L249_5555 [Ophiocordyceps polyrhachis-furcata BCC 54312]|uniref:MARVEL domain-containing protein n=1 Tax=Ophiocordyceps polyrhachis-furcata BCC 54312 TaxID=1330021 RepID=A0A367LGN4_9HYPO|nr:hypothetical protein L249_5555 [Ophiocordyceps polyrhachis-furcata BCC 54312]
MIFALVFVCTRIAQIVTLIPIMGMLAWFVNIFVSNNALTPDSILILFITTVLALAWAVFTLFSYHRSSANARFVALVDLAICGTLIAAVYQLRGIASADCVPNPSPPRFWAPLVGVPSGLGWGPADKPCAMLKASWAFAIMNIIFFFFTALAAFSHGDHLSAIAYDDGRYRESERHRHHHHRHHHHRSHSDGGRVRSRSRHSSRSHRSPHSYTRHVYV